MANQFLPIYKHFFNKACFSIHITYVVHSIRFQTLLVQAFNDPRSLHFSLRVWIIIYIYVTIYILGSLNKFPDFFCIGTLIDSTHMKL